MLTDAQLGFKKKEKRKHCIEHSAAANPPPKPHAQKAQRRRVCGSTNVLGNQKKLRSSIKQKKIKNKSADI
jgi:hypothetical protein